MAGSNDAAHPSRAMPFTRRALPPGTDPTRPWGASYIGRPLGGTPRLRVHGAMPLAMGRRAKLGPAQAPYLHLASPEQGVGWWEKLGRTLRCGPQAKMDTEVVDIDRRPTRPVDRKG